MVTAQAPVSNPVPYPASLNIDYPDRKLNRLTSFFRLITMIPVVILMALLGSITSIPLVLIILFRKIYPKWWFDWNLAYSKFSTRVKAYMFLMNDAYPSTFEDQNVHLDLVYPDAKTQLRRGLPLVKWILAIPHFVILYFLAIGACVCEIIAWFAILFTGRFPKGLFDFIVGVFRWTFRVMAYACLMTTDQYPPFSLD
jgi:hypothetical protein